MSDIRFPDIIDSTSADKTSLAHTGFSHVWLIFMFSDNIQYKFNYKIKVCLLLRASPASRSARRQAIGSCLFYVPTVHFICSRHG
jgi:hypothetical protein